MTKTVNPFIVSGKIPNAYFCDREEESASLFRYITSEENVVLMSQRRMGKTKLVEHCFDNSPDFGDASPKNINWAGAPTSDYRKLHKFFF